jgi:EmrB/QacA subfamily drug resistance transporter
MTASQQDNGRNPAGGSLLSAGPTQGWLAPGPRATAIIYAVGMFMTIMDTQIVNVALTSLSRDFHVTDASVQWVVTAYMMSLAVCVAASGWIGDRFGAKRVFLVSVAGFTVASALCAVSVSLPELILMRVLQGAGAGIMAPVGMALVFRAYAPDRRVHVTRLITRVQALAPATAPLIGGALVTWATWRWIFTINIPVGAVCVLLGIFVLLDHREPRRGGFDLSGAFLGIVGLGSLLFAVGAGPTAGWSSAEVTAAGGTGLVTLAFFAVTELRRPDPLLDVRILSDRLFRWSTVTNMLAMWAFFGSLVFTALYVQEARGLSAMDSGLTTFPEAVAIGLISGPVARLFPRVGPRRLILGGFLGLALSTGLLAQAGPSTSLWWVRAFCFLLGISVAFIMLPTQAAAFARVPSASTGHASAIFNTFQRTSMSLGVAVLSAVLALAGGNVLGLRPPVSAFHWVFLTNAAVALAGAVLSLRIVDSDAEPAMSQPGAPQAQVERAGLAGRPPSRQRGHQLVHGPAAAGVERDLNPGVHPGPRTAQVPHEVHDPVQFIGLEREHPLVVVEREAGHRVGPDVGVIPRHQAVLDQHLPPVGVVEQVPLVGPHERVHADVVLRLLSGQERGHVALVELGRPVQCHGRPDRLAGPAQAGAAEPRVHLLQVIWGRRDPPEHVVRVGAQPLHVVAAAGDHFLARRLLAQFADLCRQAGPATLGLCRDRVKLPDAPHPEHRPHGVPD